MICRVCKKNHNGPKKTCNKCREYSSRWYKEKTENGICYQCGGSAEIGKKRCKACLDRAAEVMRNYRKTPEGTAALMWSNIKNRCGKKGPYKKIKIEMKRSDFLEWAIPRIEEFLKNNETKSPSCDRINPDDNYKISNLRIVSLEENRMRSRFFSSICKINDDSPVKIKTDFVVHLVECTCKNLNLDVDLDKLKKSIGG